MLLLSDTNTICQWSTSLSSVAIFQHHQRIQFTFYNSYVILELVPSTVIFWTELTFLRNNYSNVIATKVIRSSSQSGWPLRNIHISNGIGSFTFYVYVFFPLSLPRLLPSWPVYMSNKADVIPLRQYLSSPPVFCGVHVAHLFGVFLLLFYCASLFSAFRVVVSISISA